MILIPIGSMVLLYMVCHGSHQYTTNSMLAFFSQHQPDPSWDMDPLHFSLGFPWLSHVWHRHCSAPRTLRGPIGDRLSRNRRNGVSVDVVDVDVDVVVLRRDQLKLIRLRDCRSCCLGKLEKTSLFFWRSLDNMDIYSFNSKNDIYIYIYLYIYIYVCV